MTRTVRGAAGLLALGLAGVGLAGSAPLIIVHMGNTPVTDKGWPDGTLLVANRAERIGYWEGPPFGTGALHGFWFHCPDTATFQKVVDDFATLGAAELELVVRDGSYEGIGADRELDNGKKQPRTDWTFEVWIPSDWHRLYNDPRNRWLRGERGGPVPAPRIDVYTGGAVEWEAITVPDRVKVIDKRNCAAPVPVRDGGTVHGCVWDMATGKRIAGAEVKLEPYHAEGEHPDPVITTTHDDGTFAVAGIPAAHYRVIASADGFSTRSQGTFQNRGETFEEYQITLAPVAQIIGRVVDEHGAPVAGVRVSADCLALDGLAYDACTAESAETDAEGRFVCGGLPWGYATLRCRAEGIYQPRSDEYSAAPQPRRKRRRRSWSNRTRSCCESWDPARFRSR